MEYLSKNEKETHQIAGKIAGNSKPGDIYALFGNLGAGKTSFTKGFAKAIGVKHEITSPTFVIMKKYPINAPGLSRIHNFVHIDCYRIKTINDAESVGLIEVLKNKDNSTIIIEWPENISTILPQKTKKIFLEYVNEKKRKITY